METGRREKLQKDELLARVEVFLTQLLQKIKLDVRFRCSLSDGTASVEIDGPDSEFILGDNARVLYAINHLLNQAFYRRSSDGYSFIVDCEGYRAMRDEELQLMAQKAAEQVRHSGNACELQPMPAGERRIIHLTLAEQSGVRTESEGSGQYRRVIILPAP